MTRLDAFLAGDRPDDVAIFLSDDVVRNREALSGYTDGVDGGLVLVVEGERGRPAFERAVGEDAMAFARRAGEHEGTVGRDLAGGECPDADGGDHRPAIVLAFAEGRNEAAGGIYAEGDVIHAYARCSCGTHYSDRWVADGG